MYTVDKQSYTMVESISGRDFVFEEQMLRACT